ncbi:MAG: hypothetical protein FJW96_03285 [Actinobacteria bacterium]|nr:hypothetical protein [Actinomycetota bacterium]
MFAPRQTDVERDPYVKANLRLFDRLPRYPGAKLDRKASTAYRSEPGGAIAGYVTRFRLVLPGSATRVAVRRFFRRQLAARWRLLEPPSASMLSFRRGARLVRVNLGGVRAQRLTIAVDHARFDT